MEALIPIGFLLFFLVWEIVGINDHFVVLVRCVYIKTVMEHFLSLRSGVGIDVVLSAARNLTAVLG